MITSHNHIRPLLSLPNLELDATGENIAGLINKSFTKLGVPRKNCVAFGCDNASVMTGCNKGCVTCIQQQYKSHHCSSIQSSLKILCIIPQSAWFDSGLEAYSSFVSIIFGFIFSAKLMKNSHIVSVLCWGFCGYLITFDIDHPEAYVSWHNILLYRWMISFLSVLLFNDIVEQYSKINFVPYVFECRENAYYFSLFLIYQISLFLVSQGWQIWYSQWTGH